MNLKLLAQLCETPGIPGREERVRALIEKEVKGLFDEVRTDPMGSLICTLHGSGTPGADAGKKKTSKKPDGDGANRRQRVMLAAHMDEIGFFVRHVDDKGFLWLNPAGGFDARNLFSRRVLVCCDDGDHVGMLNPGGKPIHISSEDERKKVPDLCDFYVDLGMEADAVRKLVNIGDSVVMHEPFVETPQKVVSKALDNRVACFIAIEAVRKLKSAKSTHGCELVVVFTVQEEVGLRGAITAANAVGADIGIGLDVTLACDTPGVNENQRVTKQGDGVAIMVQDSSMISDAQLIRDLVNIAEKKKIAYQRCILPRGGQDGAAIQRSGPGARTAAVVIGTRYIHTVTEMVDKRDLRASIDLLAAWIPTVC